MRHVPTHVDDGGRVIITRRACRRSLLIGGHVRVIIAIMGCRTLLEGGMDGHLKPIQRSRSGICLLGPREYEIAHFEVLIFPKMTSVPLSGREKKNEETTYKSGGLEAKFTR
jgi:hypothetical protein